MMKALSEAPMQHHTKKLLLALLALFAIVGIFLVWFFVYHPHPVAHGPVIP